MQVSRLSAQLALRSELGDWYGDATSVPYGPFWIELSPQTDDRLRHCTNTGSIPLKFYIPDRLKQSKYLNDERTKSCVFPSVLIIYPQMQKSFPSVLPKRVHQFAVPMYSKTSQRKRARHQRTSRYKNSKQSLIVLSKNNHLEAKKRRSLHPKKGYYL